MITVQDVVSEMCTSFNSFLGWGRSSCSIGCNAGKKGLVKAGRSSLSKRATLVLLGP